MYLNRKTSLFAIIALLLVSLFACVSPDSGPFQKNEEQQHDGQQHDGQQHDGAYIVSAADGRKLRVTPYGDSIVRLQLADVGENFLADNHYEMVARHDWPRRLEMTDNGSHWIFTGSAQPRLKVLVKKSDLTVSFFQNGQQVLAETGKGRQDNNRLSIEFAHDRKENFTGLGHGYYGREQSLNLKGTLVERNYGREQIEQAPLIVPFYMSSRGYGVFLNSTFSNQFNFGQSGNYSMAIDDLGYGGQLDYFFIAGPQLRTVLDRYTQLTGRPRLPMKAMFGLQLSDKGHDHNSATPSDQTWWQEKILAHRRAGFPLDHVINDNRWRAAGGKRCVSELAWDKERYPDPRDYAQWLDDNGLVITLDFNRCIAQFSDGWNPQFNIPETGKVDFETSAPDLTNAEFRQWFWQIFEQKSLDPSLGYPGDALWIDEFDEMGAAPKAMTLADGRSSAEMRNYWFFLIAKALVQQGWDTAELNKRPFVWVRGMTAGAQRYATLWSGDIYPNHDDMETQIRAMQLAGLSGFPYWGHDAGGFFDWEAEKGPGADLYQQWAMAFGSFSPIWKPHGMGHSRWPLDRTAPEQAAARHYSRLRYELMPYLYTAAHQAAATGLPMARAMLLDYQDQPLAWQYDLQYMWGDSLLVAPNSSTVSEKPLWLPQGGWFKFRSNEQLSGDRELLVDAAPGELPLYVKAGAIIPARDYVLSTAFIDKERLVLDVYAGDSGTLSLIEDDDRTEAYRRNRARMVTEISFDLDRETLRIAGAEGSYAGAPDARSYQINLYGFTPLSCVSIDEQTIPVRKLPGGAYRFEYPKTDIRQTLTFSLCR